MHRPTPSPNRQASRALRRGKARVRARVARAREQWLSVRHHEQTLQGLASDHRRRGGDPAARRREGAIFSRPDRQMARI